MRKQRRKPGGPSPIAVYDIMREAANRVAAVLSERVADDEVDDPMLRALRQLNDAVNAVATDHRRQQRVMTHRLRHLYERLIDDPQHADRLTVVAWRKVTRSVLPVPRPPASASDNDATVE